MKVADLVQKLGLEVKAGRSKLDNEVTGGYASDLLSDVLGKAKEGNLWITLQIHHNIIAVASMKDLSAIVLINGREPDEETTKKAESEEIPLLVSQLSAFELIGKLYSLGITGK